MRKRINRLAIASSDNYQQSRVIHRQMLLENHVKNSHLFMTITTKQPSTVTIPEDSLVSFEEGLKQQIALFRSNRR